jgi:hypothetical protein
MDGMGDLDNAPMPPMGTDDKGMNDPMGGGEPLMDDPNAMSDQDPMGGGDPNAMGAENPEDDELNNIVDGMSAEDKAAVVKYAKSIADDSNAAPQDGGMPMESTSNYKGIIDEVINDVLNDYEGTKRPENVMPKEYRNQPLTPFQSPYFK